jgi:hypothetical protein
MTPSIKVGFVATDDIAGIKNHDTSVVVVRPGVDDAQPGDPDVLLARDVKQAHQVVRQSDAAAVNRHRLARVGSEGDIVAGTARATKLLQEKKGIPSPHSSVESYRCSHTG